MSERELTLDVVDPLVDGDTLDIARSQHRRTKLTSEAYNLVCTFTVESYDAPIKREVPWCWLRWVNTGVLNKHTDPPEQGRHGIVDGVVLLSKAQFPSRPPVKLAEMFVAFKLLGTCLANASPVFSRVLDLQDTYKHHD